MEEMSETNLTGLLVELLICQSLTITGAHPGEGIMRKEVAEAFGIDIKAIEKRLAEGKAAKKKPSLAKAAAKAGLNGHKPGCTFEKDLEAAVQKTKLLREAISCQPKNAVGKALGVLSRFGCGTIHEVLTRANDLGMDVVDALATIPGVGRPSAIEIATQIAAMGYTVTQTPAKKLLPGQMAEA